MIPLAPAVEEVQEAEPLTAEKALFHPRSKEKARGRQIMTLHKFAIGQAVDFDKMLPSISRPKGPFEIVSVLSVDDANSPTYRIKSKAELFSRAAKEIDLVAVDLPPSEQAAAAVWADPVSGRWLPRPFRSR